MARNPHAPMSADSTPTLPERPTPGFVDMAPGASTSITMQAGATTRSAVDLSRPKVHVREYRVIKGGLVMIDSCRVPIREGKIVSSLTYDIHRDLVKQGIGLEEINPPPPLEENLEEKKD